MTKPVLVFILTTVLCGATLGADPTATIRAVKPSIVAVGTYMALRGHRESLRGTGFAVGGGNHAITNSHVVPRELDEGRRESVAVFLPRKGGRLEMRRARVVKRDIVHDLCLLSFEGAGIKPLRLGRDADVREGELLAFTGYPILNVLWLYPATHQGIVSAIAPLAFPPDLAKPVKGEDLKKLIRPFDAFRLDATAYPGNSGSPVFEVGSGRVVGVINSVQRSAGKASATANPSGISFAIPVGYVRKLLSIAGVKH